MNMRCIEVEVSFDDYMDARIDGRIPDGVSQEDALMTLFRDRGIHMDGEENMKPTPPVEIITDEKNRVFIIKQWRGK